MFALVLQHQERRRVRAVDIEPRRHGRKLLRDRVLALAIDRVVAAHRQHEVLQYRVEERRVPVGCCMHTAGRERALREKKRTVSNNISLIASSLLAMPWSPRPRQRTLTAKVRRRERYRRETHGLLTFVASAHCCTSLCAALRKPGVRTILAQHIQTGVVVGRAWFARGADRRLKLHDLGVQIHTIRGKQNTKHFGLYPKTCVVLV